VTPFLMKRLNPPARQIPLLVAALFLTVAADMNAAEVVGFLQPVREEVLSASVLGRVAQIHFKDGAQVSEGEIILELDKRSEEIEAARRKIVWETKSELEAANARRDTVQRDHDASKKLAETTRSVSGEELAKKALELRVANAEVEQAQKREEIEQLEYEFAVEQVHRREIRAPHSGQIVEVLPKVGEVCEARQPLVRLVDVSQCHFIANLDAAQTFGLKLGQKLPVEVAAAGGTVKVEGAVEFISPVIDAASGLRRIRLLIDNREGRLVPGSSAILRLN
jgi:RND family efflux transporter MFP subunit